MGFKNIIISDLNKAIRLIYNGSKNKIKKILYLISFVFYIIIDIPVLFLKKCTELLKISVEIFFEFVSKFVNLFYNKTISEEKKKIAIRKKLFENAKNMIITNKVGIFKNTNSKVVAVSAASLLQIVSFFTTLAGIMFYFSGINYLAPYLVTLVIQGMLLYLSVFAFDKKNNYSRTIALLIVMVLVSSAFSFIGIANTVMNPVNDYENNYNKYYDNYQKGYDIFMIEMSKYSNIDNQIDSCINGLISITNNAKNQELSLKKEIDDARINGKPIFNPIINTTIDKKTGSESTSSSYDINFYNVDKSNAVINDLSPKVAGIDSALAEIRNLLGEQNSKTKIYNYNKNYNKFRHNLMVEIKNNDNQVLNIVAKNISDVDNQNLSFNCQIELLSLQRKCIDLIEILGENKDRYVWLDQAQINSLITNKKIYSEIQALRLNEFESFTGEKIIKKDGYIEAPSIFESVLLSFTPRGKSNIDYLKNSLETEIFTKYNKLTTLIDAHVFDDKKIKNDITSLINKTPVFTSTYIIAFTRFFDQGKWPLALFALFIALFLDILTILIPFVILRRRSSSLYASDTKDFCGEEEELLQAIFQSLMIEKSNSSISDNDNSFDILTDDFINNLRDFLKIFKISPYTTKLGFTYRASKKELESEDKYKELIALLLSLNYLQIITVEEEKILKLDYFNMLKGNENENSKTSENMDEKEIEEGIKNGNQGLVAKIEEKEDSDEYVYLLKQKIVFWITDSLSDCFESGVLKNYFDKLEI